jgi:L-ascorbate metabolism protein UlaG (beta-lactamase superfamily)
MQMNYLQNFETDHVPTSAAELSLTFLGHGSLLLSFNSKQIYLDPFGKVADYSQLPKADLVLITHEHGDHLDLEALKHIRKPDTNLVITQACRGQVQGGIVLRNGESRTVQSIPVEAVPAYNLVHLRPDGQPFHPKGVGNGYILTFGDARVYIGGDTEDIPEMASLKDLAIAFLPMNLPYTMTPEMVAKAAKVFRPKMLYPYHFGDTDTSKLTALLKDEPGIEVRVRKMA